MLVVLLAGHEAGNKPKGDRLPMNPTNTATEPQEKLSERLFRLEPRIRYVALNQKGEIREMVQSSQHPSFNSPESDRIEELIVNPIVLEITARRGNLDMDGIRYVVIRYGTQYQVLLPYQNGHLSIGVNLEDDPLEVARKVSAALNLRA
jgi:hypothetical protein